MHAQLQRWRDRFAAQADEARALASPLTEDAFNAPGPGGGWSVGQCLGHLLAAGEPLADRLDAAIAQAPVGSAAPYAPGGLGRWLIGGVSPGGRALPTVDRYRPVAAYNKAQTLARFDALQERLAACVASGEGRHLGRARATSPGLRLLRLDAATWLEATVQHQQRHLDQARRAAAHVTAPR